jgi:membrane associated rhomboid family serine protease
MFLHGGWFHIIGNMLYLWIFGDNVEERMGSIRFLLFYLFCGIVATFAQIYANFTSSIPILGASGAIAGVLAAYLRLFPKARIAVLVPIFYFLRVVILPAWLVLGLWILLQFAQVQVAPAKETGGVAYFAHIGGFLAGLLLMPLFVRRKR